MSLAPQAFQVSEQSTNGVLAPIHYLSAGKPWVGLSLPNHMQQLSSYRAMYITGHGSGSEIVCVQTEFVLASPLQEVWGGQIGTQVQYGGWTHAETSVKSVRMWWI